MSNKYVSLADLRSKFFNHRGHHNLAVNTWELQIGRIYIDKSSELAPVTSNKESLHRT